MDRRTALRGLVGGIGLAVGLPTLEAMLNANGEVWADGSALPVRFGLWFWGCGVCPEFWVPQAVGAAWETTPELAPLDVSLANGSSLKKYISTFSGMQAKLHGQFPHYPQACSILAGSHNPTVSFGKPDSPTVDQIVAKGWQGSAPLASIQMAASVRGDQTTYQNDISWLGSQAPNSLEFSPLGLYNSLFAGRDKDAKTMMGRRSVLDFVSADLQKLRTRVGKADAQRLDSHSQSIRDIETSLEALAKIQCSAPPIPTDPSGEIAVHEPLQERHRLFADMTVLALSCRLTRVFALQFTSVAPSVTFWQVGAPYQHHAMTHDAGSSDPALRARARDFVHRAVVFTMGELSYLAQKLGNTPEGSGSLLDNTCLFATSEFTDGTTHDDNNHPALLIGRAGGALKYPGVHYKGQNLDNASRISLTAVRAAGVNVPSFGNKEAETSSPIVEVMA